MSPSQTNARNPSTVPAESHATDAVGALRNAVERQVCSQEEAFHLAASQLAGLADSEVLLSTETLRSLHWEARTPSTKSIVVTPGTRC